MPDQVLIHDPLIDYIQRSLFARGVDQFYPWFETNGQKLIGMQQEWVYGGAGLVLMELLLPFTTSLSAHDLHDAYRKWLNNPNDQTHAEVKRQGKRVYGAQHFNEQYGSWIAHRALSSLSSVPTLRHYAVDGLKSALYTASSIYEEISRSENPELHRSVPLGEDNQLEGFLNEEFKKIASEYVQLKVYPHLLVMQQFEQI